MSTDFNKDISEENLEKSIKIVSLLEDYTSNPNFTDKINAFLSQNCKSIDEIKLESDSHTINNHNIYKKYLSLIESELEDFLKISNLNEEEVFKACLIMKDYDENYLVCLDYILASVEYEYFYNLIIDYKNIVNYEIN